MNDNNKHEDLDFYDQIITAYGNILTEIDYLVEGSTIFTEAADPRKIKLDEFLHNLNNNMDDIIRESNMRLEIRNEVEKRFEEIDMEFVCDECGSKVDSRVGMMKWNHDQDSTTAEEWLLMEKFNDKLGIGVRWLNYCTNPDCYKIWKEGEFEEEIVLPKTSIIKDKIKSEVKREWGSQ